MLRIIHLADLHLGRIFHGESLLEDQIFLLKQLVSRFETSPPDAVLLAGDIYDRALPPIDAVKQFDWFLSSLADAGITVVVIPGNHDSAGRMSYASVAWEKIGIHIRADYQRLAEPVRICSGDGSNCDVFALPFVEPALLINDVSDYGNQELPRDKISLVKSAVESMIQSREADSHKRPAILLAHEFVTGSTESGSERLYLGGSQSVPSELFESFNYVALGHIHALQKAGGDCIRYAGSPMAYAFDEKSVEKGYLEIILDNGELYPEINFLPLHPLRPLKVLEDSLENLLYSSRYDSCKDSYISARVTDVISHINLIGRLRERFPYLREIRQTALEPVAGAHSGNSDTVESRESILSDFLDRTGWKEGNERTLAEKLLEDILDSVESN